MPRNLRPRRWIAASFAVLFCAAPVSAAEPFADLQALMNAAQDAETGDAGLIEVRSAGNNGSAGAATGPGASGASSAGSEKYVPPGVNAAPAPVNDGPPPPRNPVAPPSISLTTRQAIAAINACSQRHANVCIADALDRYADALEAAWVDAPPRLRELPRIVHEAARKVRVAKTKREAAIALHVAVAKVADTLGLLRAEDPNAEPAAASVARAVTATLGAAEDKLMRADEI